MYISHSRSPKETDYPFTEPGLFVINSDGRAQLIDISNGHFSRLDNIKETLELTIISAPLYLSC